MDPEQQRLFATSVASGQWQQPLVMDAQAQQQQPGQATDLAAMAVGEGTLVGQLVVCLCIYPPIVELVVPLRRGEARVSVR